MSSDSTQQQYPRDRFDDVEPYTTQQGAHRKDFAPPKGTGHLNAIILAGGVALAIGVGSFLWLLPSDPLNQAGSEPEETVNETIEDEPQDPDEQDPDEPEEVEPVPTDEPDATDGPEDLEQDEPDELELDEPEDTADPDEPVDYELPINVYNASSVQGYAASVAQDLGAAGFNVPVADNWTGTIPDSTVVYYSDDEPTATAVADELGAVAVYEPSVDGVLVVLTAE